MATFESKHKGVSILLVTNDQNLREQVRRTLDALDYPSPSLANTHIQAVEKIKQRNFSLVLFDARKTDASPMDFVKSVLKWDQQAILIPISSQPRIDDIFGLLAAGARGYIVAPFTADSMEAALASASDGHPLSEVILHAADRNEALVGLMLNALYRLSVVKRQSREYSSAKRELSKYEKNLRENAEIMKIFCEGEVEDLQEKIIKACLERGEQAATRLGRTRQKLRRHREHNKAES